jgi:tRNA-splicing ligase RtcB (3'-phosphate/5'-hydroxy nucleic acid ligase)
VLLYPPTTMHPGVVISAGNSSNARLLIWSSPCVYDAKTGLPHCVFYNADGEPRRPVFYRLSSLKAFTTTDTEWYQRDDTISARPRVLLLMAEKNYNLIRVDNGVPIKAWTRGVLMEEAAQKQLENTAQLPIIHKWVAAMPDVHYGIGATVGSVIPTKGAIIPAAVGVDIGCGMMATQTSLRASDLPDDLKKLRTAIEKAVPHGRTNQGKAGDRGAWHRMPDAVQDAWAASLGKRYEAVIRKHPGAHASNNANHLGTLGTGNHFIEVCLDETDTVWFMLHSGSRGPGNRIGTYFIELAREDMRRHQRNLPDKDLAYLDEGTKWFDDYVEAVEWAQDYARWNRRIMMDNVIAAVRHSNEVPPFAAEVQAINCHHNYVTREHHYGEDVFVTRKGAVRAGRGDLGIIPGSMGTRSYIVRGLGNPESFESCSHGAGRAMSRGEAKRRFSVEDHKRMTAGIECRKDADVIDETPAAYKPIDAVMEAQKDLVEIVHELRQVVVVKG